MKRQEKRKGRLEKRAAPVAQPSSLQQHEFWKNYKYAALVLFLLPFILYGYSISFGYVLDDEVVITENKFVKKGFAGIWEILSTETFTGFWGSQLDAVEGARYRPLSLVTFAIEYQFLKLNPQVSHFMNVLLYGITGVALAWVLSLLFPGGETMRWFAGIPFTAALLFIAHPLHSEVVANIKSRDELLAFLFSLFALAGAIYYIFSDRKIWLFLSGVIFFLALLAKENAVTFLAVIPLAVYFFQKTIFRKMLIVWLPLIIATAIYIIIRYQVIGYLLDSGKQITGLMNNPFLYATSEQKYATIFYTLGLYVKLLFFPHPLTHDYYPYHIPLIGWGDLRAVVPLALYLAMAGYALFRFKDKAVVSFCIFYFIATLSIASNFVFNIGTFMNERFLYMPSLGFCILIAYWFIEKMPVWIKDARLKTALPLVLIFAVTTAFSAKTMMRVPDWKDIMSLDRSAVKVSVNSARINCFYGYGLYKEAQTMQGEAQMKKVDEALIYIERSLKIHPIYKDALNAKAGLLALRYQYNRDLNTLLDEFYKIQMTALMPFIDQYLDYLEKVEDKSKLIPFYQKLGTALKKAGNHQKGDYYLKKAR